MLVWAQFCLNSPDNSKIESNLQGCGLECILARANSESISGYWCAYLLCGLVNILFKVRKFGTFDQI